MTKGSLIVLTNPVPGKEKEYNEWYDNVHLSDVLDCPGIVSAQRYDAHDYVGNKSTHKYVAIYNIEHEDLVAVVEEIFRRFTQGEMVQSDALATDFVALLNTPRGAQRVA